MQKQHRLVIDSFAEIRDLMGDWPDEVFYDFGLVEARPGSVYVIGRQQMLDHMAKIRDMCASDDYVMIFNNSAEGSWTIASQLRQLKVEDLVRDRRLLLISGAEIGPGFQCLVHEHLLTKILDFSETAIAQNHTKEIYHKTGKPYRFLLLNGRARPHRKYLYERMKQLNLLDGALYTMLEAKPCVTRHFEFWQDGINIMATATELRRLPDEYEVERYRDPVFGPILPDRTFLKQELFRQEWGEIYLYHRPYVDSYFSLVTETICAESTVSFRTEKIAKPLAMGHPFIVAANAGYYRDLRNLGFRTFDHLIDESFDSIDNSQDRIDRLITVVQDLCQQDLDSFIKQAQENSIYNQQHLSTLAQKQRRDFPQRFFQFIQAGPQP